VRGLEDARLAQALVLQPDLEALAALAHERARLLDVERGGVVAGGDEAADFAAWFGMAGVGHRAQVADRLAGAGDQRLVEDDGHAGLGGGVSAGTNKPRPK